MVTRPVANTRANTISPAPRWKRHGVRRPARTAIIYYKAPSSSSNPSSSAAVSQSKSCHGNPTTSMPTNNPAKMRPITRKDIAVWLSKILGSISGLVLGILTIWYTIRAWTDGHCSAVLAQWTSQKDFWEFCSDEQNLDYKGCPEARERRLKPPPVCSKWSGGGGSSDSSIEQQHERKVEVLASDSEPRQRGSSVLEVSSERTSLSKEGSNSAEVRYVSTTLTTVGLSKTSESSTGGSRSDVLPIASSIAVLGSYTPSYFPPYFRPAGWDHSWSLANLAATTGWTTPEITTAPSMTIHLDPQTTQVTRAMRHPSSLPKIITNSNTNNKIADFHDRTMNQSDLSWLQVYFKQGLNFPFVVDYPQSAAQIFEYLPAALALAGHGQSIGSKNNIDVRSLRPCDTRQEYGFVTTVADILVPIDMKATLISLIRMNHLNVEQAESPHLGTLLSLISSDAERICGGWGDINNNTINPTDSDGEHMYYMYSKDFTTLRISLLLAFGFVALYEYMLHIARRGRKRRRMEKATKRDSLVVVDIWNLSRGVGDCC